MLGAASDEQIEAKNDMKTLQVLVVHGRRFCAVVEAPAFASVKLTFTLAAQMVLEKQLQDIIRYTNELENREATMYLAHCIFHRSNN